METKYCGICGGRIISKAGKDRGKQRWLCENGHRPLVIKIEDQEILDENIRLSRQKQKFADRNRIERKSWRNQVRLLNAIEAYSIGILDYLKQTDLGKWIPVKDMPRAEEMPEGIIHLTDLHFNEVVNLGFNQYDFEIASRRLRLLAERAIEYFKALSVQKVHICMTGDLLNSDLRLDKLLQQGTNRSKATVLAVVILEQFILHIAQHFIVDFTGVVGNEGRVKLEKGYTDIVATDNYDFTIMAILRLLFRGTTVRWEEGEKIPLVPHHVSDVEKIIRVKQQFVALVHGDTITAPAKVTSFADKYAIGGYPLRMILYGHIHSCKIGDRDARSASLVGANAYSAHGLQIAVSRASQNLHIVFPDGRIDSIKIDLQTGYGDGYDIAALAQSYRIQRAEEE